MVGFVRNLKLIHWLRRYIHVTGASGVMFATITSCSLYAVTGVNLTGANKICTCTLFI